MKEFKCFHLMRFGFMRYWRVLALLFVCFFSPLLLGSGSASAKQVEGFADSSWVGIVNYLAPFQDNYVWESGWTSKGVNGSIPLATGNFSRYYVKNISHSAPIQITPEMVSNGRLDFSGILDISVNVCSPNNYSGFSVTDVNTFLDDWGTFNIGIDTNRGVYDAQNVVSTSITSSSQLTMGNSCAAIRYNIRFSAHYATFTQSGSFRLNWRLNGNNATNGGRGSYFANYGVSAGNDKLLTYNMTSAAYLLDITEGSVVDPPDPSNPDYTSKFNELNNSLGDIKNQNNTIIDQNSEIINNQKETTDAIKDQTKQQEDQYNKDKAEESDRENQGKDDADQAQGIFNFNILNPFAPLFEMFNPSGCVSIPTLHDWLNTKDTQVCPWFPAKVRSVVTPVLSIASIMLIFGFVSRWLGGSNTTLFRSDI